jgi:hypothetical protein
MKHPVACMSTKPFARILLVLLCVGWGQRTPRRWILGAPHMGTWPIRKAWVRPYPQWISIRKIHLGPQEGRCLRRRSHRHDLGVAAQPERDGNV